MGGVRDTSFRRKGNRLSQDLYRGGYWYFITICTSHHTCIFVEEGLPLQGNRFVLNSIGSVVEKHLLGLSQSYPGVRIEDYVIMPNHIHAIVSIEEVGQMSLSEVMRRMKAYIQVEVREKVREGSIREETWKGKPSATKSLESNLWRDKPSATKSLKSNLWRDKPSATGSAFSLEKMWQKSFYDHIIRDEKDLIRIREYILHNPVKWELDTLHPEYVK